ncbi:DUF2726 domain-containing protein [Oleiagrimonas soli]|uniref:DUF2726 domain-containing protein n=1 Tax=Oleiagrimonas soli TaxID=1543381 RepID=A0A841KQV3_9GAMM|nr:DUF2726 domain-containing protein [Oleiagrimonas soli]MBB6184378.1 hypothetical protein [Oleiagrimonas soli]
MLGALVVLKQAAGGGSVGLPYRARKQLFSAAERSFLGVLDTAVGPEYRVFGKVRIADIATVRSGLGASARRAALNRIAFKHVDFVVCRADDLSVVCAVELDDASHRGARARRRDAFVADVCRVIGLPLLQVPARSGYAMHALREGFLDCIAPQATLHATAPAARRG